MRLSESGVRNPVTTLMVFLAILVVGFVYEWRRGALNWE